MVGVCGPRVCPSHVLLYIWTVSWYTGWDTLCFTEYHCDISRYVHTPSIHRGFWRWLIPVHCHGEVTWLVRGVCRGADKTEQTLSASLWWLSTFSIFPTERRGDKEVGLPGKETGRRVLVLGAQSSWDLLFATCAHAQLSSARLSPSLMANRLLTLPPAVRSSVSSLLFTLHSQQILGLQDSLRHLLVTDETHWKSLGLRWRFAHLSVDTPLYPPSSSWSVRRSQVCRLSPGVTQVATTVTMTLMSRCRMYWADNSVSRMNCFM